MPEEIYLRLQGQNAKLGVVPAVDVARLIIGFERVLANVASQIVGRRAGLAGRKGAAVEEATRLRLVGVRRGSVIPVLVLPDVKFDDELDLDDQSLGSLALSTALQIARGDSNDPEIAEWWFEFANDVAVGTKYKSLTIKQPQHGRLRNMAVLDKKNKSRLQSVASEAYPQRPDSVVGTVFEADFERNTARVRTASHIVTVSFPNELADDIHRVLRHQTQLQGQVRYDKRTGAVISLKVSDVIRTEQLLMDLESQKYWQGKSVDQLIEERTTPPASSSRDLVDPDGLDDEVEAFLEAIGAEGG